MTNPQTKNDPTTSRQTTGFLTDLQVRRNLDNDRWILTEPLIWQGDWQILYIKPGFSTDFASVPRPVRWLLDTGGRNAAAGVLHDAAWRESKLAAEVRRVEPWDADGLFRRALRYAGVPAIPRNMLWIGVRVPATLQGRIGRSGIGLVTQILKIAMWGVLALLIIGGPILAIGIGYVIYLVLAMLATPITRIYKARRERNGDKYDAHEVLPLTGERQVEPIVTGGPIPHLLVINIDNVNTSTKRNDTDHEKLVARDAELHQWVKDYVVARRIADKTAAAADYDEDNPRPPLIWQNDATAPLLQKAHQH